MIRQILALVLIVSTPLTWAAPKSLPKTDVFIEIQHGDLATRFKIDASAGTMTMYNSLGSKKTRQIAGENLAYLISEANKLPNTTKRLPPECLRAQISVTIGSGKSAIRKYSCFGIKSITSKSYQDLANLLAVVI
jgi:hypothetical protein